VSIMACPSPSEVLQAAEHAFDFVAVRQWRVAVLTLAIGLGRNVRRDAASLADAWPDALRPQLNRLDTLSSLAVRAIASPISGPIGMTLILCTAATSGVAWIVSVMTSSCNLDFAMRCAAAPESTPWVI